MLHDPYLAYQFARCNPNCDSRMIADFLHAVDNIGKVPLAQDQAPNPNLLPLDPDLLDLVEEAHGQSNIIQQLYDEQAQRNANGPLNGGSSMAYPRRTNRDEDVIPTGNRGMTPRGGMFGTTIDQDPDDPDDAGASMTPETLAGFVQLCANRLQANDDGGESHNQFMNLLGQMVANAHQQGMMNGGPPNGDRKRAARDNGYRATPAGGMSSFNGRGSMDRQRRAAQDSAFIKRNLDSKSFLQRFPDARKISIR